MLGIFQSLMCAGGIYCLLLFGSIASASEMFFYGGLSDPVCKITPDAANLEVDFGAVTASFLYANVRTAGKAFNVVLTDCEGRWGGQFSLAIMGEENPELAGHLIIRKGSHSTGVAIGIETQDGKLQPINAPGKFYPFYAGENIIPVVAFLKAEPMAIKNRTIRVASFEASALFNISYN